MALGFKRERSNEHVLGFVVFLVCNCYIYRVCQESDREKSIHTYIYIYVDFSWFMKSKDADSSNEHVLGFVVVLGFTRERSNEHVLGFVVVLGFKRERSNEHVLGFVVVLGFKRERSNEHVLGFVVVLGFKRER